MNRECREKGHDYVTHGLWVICHRCLKRVYFGTRTQENDE